MVSMHHSLVTRLKSNILFPIYLHGKLKTFIPWVKNLATHLVNVFQFHY